MPRIFALLAAAIAPALCASAVAARTEPAAVETSAQALAEDANQYAAQFQVTRDEALRRLDAEQASVPATDAIAREFADRLAGMAIEHVPEYRVVVLLTGTQPVADRTAAGVPIVFRTGAKATRTQAIAAMKTHLIDIRSELPGLRGAGYDQRTGEIVLLIRPEDAQRLGIAAIRARAEQVGGVPVRVVVNDLLESNMEIDGGERVEGLNGETGRRNICTSGFVVTDGARGGIATAAHCPDELTYLAPDGSSVPLAFAGQWGLAYQDVQINLSPDATEPIFRATSSAGSLRRLATWRNRGSTRAGDFVCHFGESSGYSCAEVELTDYAPPGALCGGPCEPTWVTVRGPGCIAGDSGGPVFSGAVAFGIAKGINRSSSGRCNFYYYMSTDYLPPPWRLLTTGDPISPPPHRP
jgi:streptogrisin C